jgi:hypothetical protein
VQRSFRKNTVFCNITQFSLIEVNRCFGETYVFRVGGLSQANKQAWLATCLFFVIYFDSEDGGSHVHRQNFLTGGRRIRKYSSKLILKPFKNIFTDHLRVMCLFTNNLNFYYQCFTYFIFFSILICLRKFIRPDLPSCRRPWRQYVPAKCW